MTWLWLWQCVWPETQRCTAGIDDTLHAWLCICWLWNKTTSQGYLRFWPTVCSTHCLASMSHTLRVHFTHLSYTELSNNFNSNLHGHPWTQLVFGLFLRTLKQSVTYIWCLTASYIGQAVMIHLWSLELQQIYMHKVEQGVMLGQCIDLFQSK